IAVTTSRCFVYDDEATVKRLVIGVGAYKPDLAEIIPRTILASQVFADDRAGAQHEAGDLIQAHVDWTRVSSLAAAIKQRPDGTKPIMFKSVGCAAWDLASCRLAKKVLEQAGRLRSA
ncbi:MAG: hypothetical protein AB7K04_15675, partial [Pseudorhodoplanes sp.]